MKKRKKNSKRDNDVEFRFSDEDDVAEEASEYAEDIADEAANDEAAIEETAEDILRTVTDDGEYYAVNAESGNLLWSAISIIFAVLSVVLFSFFYIGAIISAAIAITLSVIASRKLGFFDRMALFGLIFGIFGAVFGIFSMIIDLSGIFAGVV